MKNFWLDHKEQIDKVIEILIESTRGMVEPSITLIVKQFGREPFLVLVSCILSLRTKDTVSWPASLRLFSVAKSPKEIMLLDQKEIEKIIYPVGFYHTKAKSLLEVSRILVEKFDGNTPDNYKDLIGLPGVGPKTANLVLGAGFGVPAICVDTHVHRISNRLGLVDTKKPEATQMELEKVLPEKYWLKYNNLLVMWGQNICVPVSPFCSKCAISHLCPKFGVKKAR